MSDEYEMQHRLVLVRAAGVPVSKADEERVGASVVASLKALDEAAGGSLFDTEPAHFERALLRSARPAAKSG